MKMTYPDKRVFLLPGGGAAGHHAGPGLLLVRERHGREVAGPRHGREDRRGGGEGDGEVRSPGALVGVWKGDGTTLVKAYGLARTDPEEAMRAGMGFRAGSVTKTFTGNLALQLVDQGRLSLDDPVSRYVEGVPDGDRITVRMLLNHSSGLFNYGADKALNETITADPHKVWTPAELVAVAVSNPPYFPPGEGCTYSNTNYVLLGMIIEKVTGRAFEDDWPRA